MPNAPPHATDRVFEFLDICRFLDVNATTLSTWVGFAKILRPFGGKRGHRRVFSQHEAYVMALMASLHHAGVPVSPGIVATLLSATHAPDPAIPDPGETITVRQTANAGIVLHGHTIWVDVCEKLQELENV